MSRTDVGQGRTACRVFHPCDAVSAFRCVELMANLDGMCYMRTHRPEVGFIYPFDERFELCGSKQLRSGEHLTIVSSGYMLHSVLDAAARLLENGISSNVFDVYVFPLDATPILERARAGGSVILTVEDNYLGGLHAELAEAAADAGDIRVSGMTVRRIPKSPRTADDIFSHVGVGLADIIERATSLAQR